MLTLCVPVCSQKDSDCFQKCPQHPLTGSYYRCAKSGYFRYFDTPVTSGGSGVLPDTQAGIEYVNLSTGVASSFDVEAGSGVCVDTIPSMAQTCPIENFAKALDAVIGCFDRRIAKFLCGLEVHVKHGDASQTSVEGNFFYPRELYAGFSCTDPVDCVDKCKYLGRTSVNGMGAPPTCAMCVLSRLPLHAFWLLSPSRVSSYLCARAGATNTARSIFCPRSRSSWTPSTPT